MQDDVDRVELLSGAGTDPDLIEKILVEGSPDKPRGINDYPTALNPKMQVITRCIARVAHYTAAAAWLVRPQAAALSSSVTSCRAEIDLDAGMHCRAGRPSRCGMSACPPSGLKSRLEQP